MIRSHMVRETGDAEVIEYFKSLSWMIIPVDQEAEFELVTSDRPLVINFGGEQSPIVTLSIPLRPKLLFYAEGTGFDLLKVAPSATEFFLMQQLQVMKAAYRVIYSRTRLDGWTLKMARQCLGCVGESADEDA